MKLIFIYILFLSLEIANSYEGVFWHICDMHLNLSYQSFANKNFGDYKSDSPFTLIESAFTQMKNVYPNPDFIILNGDNVRHYDVSENEFEKSLKNVSEELRKKFPIANILPSFGNHDINPANLFDLNSSYCQNLFKFWKTFFNKASNFELETFKKGCYYSRLIKSNNSEIHVIVLNTLLWYSVNTFVEKLEDPLDQFQWLENELKQSRNMKIKVFIIGHIPPGASEFSPNKFRHFHPHFNARFLNIMQQYGDIIDAGFFSHQHTDAFKIVFDQHNKPIIPLFLSPSITPYYLRGLGSVNPSVRLYFWNNSSTNRRFKQYHTNLNSFQDNHLNWTLEYISTSLLPGLSATHLHDLILDFEKENSVYFDKFFHYHLSGQFHDTNDCSINSPCRCNIICGMQYIDYTLLDSCLKKCPQKTLSQWVMIASVIIIFTIILIGVVIGANKVYCYARRTASLTRDIYLAPFNGKNCEEIMSEHIDNIAENTFGDVPEYRGHIRNNSRTILTLNDGNEIIEKSQPSISKFALQSKNKSQEKYDYTRM